MDLRCASSFVQAKRSVKMKNEVTKTTFKLVQEQLLSYKKGVRPEMTMAKWQKATFKCQINK